MSTAEILAELPTLSPDDLAKVQAKLDELSIGTGHDARHSRESPAIASHPAVGMWRDRTDLASDPTEASRQLRQRLMRLDADRAGDA